ncbi:hypothetical protein KEM55_002639 [Ascosphaera atra]|nr:hypothetical protein KEM55_002639 [Ascosphaera atra]
MSSPKPLFRSVKKHKALRKRPAEDIEEPQPTPSEAVPAPITDKAKRLELDDSNAAPEEDEDTEAILAEKIHRQRGLRRRKGLGIEFTPESGTADHSRHVSEEVAKTDENPEDETIKAITSRFVGHTGQKVDVDEHMYV